MLVLICYSGLIFAYVNIEGHSFLFLLFITWKMPPVSADTLLMQAVGKETRTRLNYDRTVAIRCVAM